VTVGTITRSYAEAARRGLVGGEVGRGTFVSDGLLDDTTFLHRDLEPSNVDLSLNLPVGSALDQELPRALAALAEEPGLSGLAGYLANAGVPAHREAGAEWIRRAGVDADADRMLVTGGAQHAMATVFATLCDPGDVVLTEALTYPGMKGLANLLHLRLVPVAMDELGMLPSAFEAAVRSAKPSALYTMPTLHNPAATILPAERREEIAAIAVEHGVPIVEDDSYGFLVPEPPPPLTSFAPDTSFYLTSVSKSMTSALRIGFALAPPGWLERLTASLWSISWMASPLMAEVATRWIFDGTADTIVRSKRREAERRQEIAERTLGRWKLRSHPQAFHAWLELPTPWRADDFVAQARRRGVTVTPTDAFVVGRSPSPQAVRVCFGPEPDRKRLERGLRTLDDILCGRPEPPRTPFV
jgi:DNA-binding transcriptional MocR family regulator